MRSRVWVLGVLLAASACGGATEDGGSGTGSPGGASGSDGDAGSGGTGGGAASNGSGGTVSGSSGAGGSGAAVGGSGGAGGSGAIGPGPGGAGPGGSVGVGGGTGGTGPGGSSGTGGTGLGGSSGSGGSSPGGSGGTAGELGEGEEYVPPTPEGREAFRDCILPRVTRRAVGSSYTGHVYDWAESVGGLIFDANGARISNQAPKPDAGIVWWSIAGVPTMSYYLYSELGAPDPSTLLAGPYPDDLRVLDPSMAAFSGETVSSSVPRIVLLEYRASGHLLAVRVDGFEYGGPATCGTGVLASVTYWLLPYGQGSFADFL